MAELTPTKKALVLLSGAGVFDGSEIHESTLCLLALTQVGIEYQCIAPDILQERVVDHVTQTPQANEKRRVVQEAARIARGNILTLSSDSIEATVAQYDALVIPGGFGVATTLSNYAMAKNADPSVEPTVSALLQGWLSKKKPCMATCISPVLLAIVGKKISQRFRLTLGEGENDLQWLVQQGMDGILSPSHDCVVDRAHNIVSTPAYMNRAPLADIWKGIQKARDSLVSLIASSSKDIQ